MSKSIFISHVHEDKFYLQQIKDWVRQGCLPNIVATSETEDLRNLGEAAIKKHLTDKIRGAAVVLVLIGNDTHNHHWIKYEVEVANSLHKRIVCVRIPNAKGAIPTILNGKPLVNYGINEINACIQYQSLIFDNDPSMKGGCLSNERTTSLSLTYSFHVTLIRPSYLNF